MALTDKQVILYMKNRNKGATQEVAAARGGISVRSARRIDKGQHQPVGHHHWRTRKDPLEPVWETEVQPMLEQQPALTPITVLEHLQDSHPGQYPDSILRTLQRRIKIWKSQHGGEKEVMFIQERQPGAQAFVDFTELKSIAITIAGQPLPHRLFHLRLPWSHWSWMSVVLGGESFSALVEGMQNGLHQLGGIPAEIRTDSLSAAWRPLSEGERTQETARYAAFCEHYGVLASHNNPGKGHENGAVESAHGHLKRRIRQALLMRGNTDFASVDEYRSFITTQVLRHNQRHAGAVAQEREHLKPLPLQRCADYEELLARVTASSTVTVKLVVYSVPSRLIGLMLKVRLWDDRLSFYNGSSEVYHCTRVRPEKGKRRARSIDFRHMLDSLVKKPNALYHAALREDILPDERWNALWRALCTRATPGLACRIMVQALKMAAERDDIDDPRKKLAQLLKSGRELTLDQVQRQLGIPVQAPAPQAVVQHKLADYEKIVSEASR